VLIAAAIGAFFVRGTLDPAWLNRVGTWLPAAVADGVAVLFAGLTTRSLTLATRARRGWLLITSALCCVFLANALWNLTTESRPEHVSWAIITLFALSYPLLGWGVLQLPAAFSARRLQIGLDVATVVISGALVLWALVLGPTLASGSLGARYAVSSALYAMGDLILLAGAALLLLRPQPDALVPAFRALAGALLLSLASDVVYGVEAPLGRYGVASWSDRLTALTSLAYAWSAHLYRRHAGQTVAAPRIPGPLGVSLLPYGAVAIAQGLLVAVVLRQTRDPLLLGLIIGAAALVLIVSVRQAYSARETVRLTAEREDARLRADSLREWEETFDAIEAPILVTDGLGRVARLNEAAARLAGATREACLGREVEALAAGEPWVTAARLARTARHVHESPSERTTDDSEGRVWDVAARLFPERGPEGRVIVTARDVTELVELEDSLRHSEKVAALGALVAGVSHEMRNPLFGLSATLDAFEARFGGRGEFAGYLVVLRRQVERVGELLTGLMEYGRPSAERRPVPIGELLDEAFAVCQRPEAGAELVRSGDWSLPAQVDRKRLVLVLRNLLENALFPPPHGCL
jgi:PAS domain S-box-containing protein